MDTLNPFITGYIRITLKNTTAQDIVSLIGLFSSGNWGVFLMSKEIVTVCIGGGGVRLGEKVWDHSDSLLSWKEDAGNIFARGYCSVGKQMIDKVNERIRELVEACNNPQGFIIKRSVRGGTGLGSLILERLSADYSKIPKV